MSGITKVLYLDEDGIISEILNGSILNIGGTSSPSFTVGGRPLLFADGSSTSGSSTDWLNLQYVIDSSPTINNTIKLELKNNKDFSIGNNISSFFKIDGETGKITINGDLEVLGASSKIESLVNDSDHQSITMNNRNTIGLKIEPDDGIIPVADLISISKLFNGSAVFRLDANGDLFVSGNLHLSSDIINGISFSDTRNKIVNHINTELNKHSASQISLTPNALFNNADNVQNGFNNLIPIITDLQNKTLSTEGKGDVIIYEHIQNNLSSSWTINHNAETFRAFAVIYDYQWQEIYPDEKLIISNKQMQINFAVPTRGRAFIYLSNVEGLVDYGNPAQAVPIVPQKLAELDDVDLAGVGANSILKFNGTKWVVGSIITSLDHLSDVEITSLQDGEILYYKDTKWKNINPISLYGQMKIQTF